ncbi:MAG: LCP family protein, partial [Anaerotignum sp.]|nr:LCP family protein [Anaerotignum sp.]
GGKEHGPEAAILQMEDLLGISIDHYVKVDFDAVVEIVDAVGGVEVDVPQDMYWDMSDTGDITINLKKGLQTLDGKKALQLVRFRRYADGDVGRIQVQQLFMKALMDKVLSTESIVKNLGDYIKVAYKYVETDVSLSDAVKYANYITKVDTGKISMETLPGAGQYVGGVSYFLHDPVATREMVDRVFYSVAPKVNADGSIDSKSLLIEVANGGEVAGLVGRFTEKLAGEGFRLTDPTTYHGEQVDYTRIQVKADGAGKDLVKYFDKARVEAASSDMGSADIRIILGTNEN